MKKFKILILLLLLTIPSGLLYAQPSVAYGGNPLAPWTYWWWQGSAVTPQGIKNQLIQIKQSGLGGAHIIPIYGVKGEEAHFQQFLSPSWLALYNYTCCEAQKLGLGIDISTGTGWPFGGPGVGPEMAAKQFEFSEFSLTDTAKINRCLNQYSFDNPVIFEIRGNNQYKQLSQSELQRFVQRADTSSKILIVHYTLTNQKVKRAAPGSEGSVIDPFDSVSMGKYLFRFDLSLFSPNIQPPRAMYNDSYEVYRATWTPTLFQSFQRQHHYDLQPVLYKLSPYFPDCEEKRTLLCDYRETMASLLFLGAKTWTNWANMHHVQTRYQAHGSPGNLLDLYALADIPETESFGSSQFPIPKVRCDSDYRASGSGRPHPLIMKFASSPANLFNKKLIASESTTWLANHFKVSLSEIKPEVDQLFVGGINHLFFHGTTYSPPQEQFPGWLFYASTNYGSHSHFFNELPLLTSYISTCQKFLQNSKSDNDLLIYFPIFDIWSNTPQNLLPLLSVHQANEWFFKTPFGELSGNLWAAGYSFDYISDAQINKLIINQDHTIGIKGGHYSAIVIPKTKAMPYATMERLIALAQKGVKIVFEDLVSLSFLGESIKIPRDQSQNSVITLEKEKAVKVGDVRLNLEEWSIRKESLTTKGLSFIRKISGSDVIYFVTNLSNQFDTDSITLSCKGVTLEYKDPMTNEGGLIHFRRLPSGIRTKLYLPPGRSCFLIAHADPIKLPSFTWPILSADSKVLEHWKVTFQEGTPAAPGKTFYPEKLDSWTTWPDSTLQWYNGYGEYETTFSMPTSWNRSTGIVLSIEDLRETASISVNGRAVGTIWSVPYQLNIPIRNFKSSGNNTIKLKVRNLSANEIRFMDTYHFPWKKFYDANIVDIAYRPFDASKWPAEPSGILGKVTLSPVF